LHPPFRLTATRLLTRVVALVCALQNRGPGGEWMDPRIRKGMNVRSTSGISLGRVTALAPGYFSVEKGASFPRDHELRYESISEIRGDEIICRLAEEATAPERKEDWQQAELAEGSELRVPLMEEKVLIQKSSKEVGAVRVHKNVVSEEQQVTVPIRREEVVVEHVPADRAAARSTHAFEDERYSIAVHEEEFEVIKQQVVREEVRVRRVTHEVQRNATATARHEELEVEDQTRQARSMSDPDKKEV
jgi:uncharacterized protein (TIGR02271 family)